MKHWEEQREESQSIRRELIPVEPEMEYEMTISDECDRWLKSDEVSEYIVGVADEHPIAMEEAFVAGWRHGCRSIVE